MNVPSTSTAPLNPQTTDLLLRLLHEVSLEISDAQLRLNKPSGRLQRDSLLRDAVREQDAPAIARSIWEIITEALDGLGQTDASNARLGLKGKTAREVAEMAIKVAGDYVCEANGRRARMTAADLVSLRSQPGLIST